MSVLLNTSQPPVTRITATENTPLIKLPVLKMDKDDFAIFQTPT